MAQFIEFRCSGGGSGVRCQGTEVLNSDNLYETTHSWNSEPQNIEQEISNDEMWNRCAQSFSIIIMLEYLTSIFVIPCSIFVIRFFRVSFSIRLAAFQARGNACMKLQSLGQ